MTKTFTLSKNIQEYQKQDQNIGSDNFSSAVLPSSQCIKNILNFSKNIEISPSKNMGYHVYLKS